MTTLLAALALLLWVYLAAARGGFWHAAERDGGGPLPEAWPSVIAVIPARDPKGHPVYWIGPAGAGADAGAGTDFLAVENGLVSVTPLSIDLTRHAALADVGHWLASL